MKYRMNVWGKNDSYTLIDFLIVQVQIRQPVDFSGIECKIKKHEQLFVSLQRNVIMSRATK